MVPISRLIAELSVVSAISHTVDLSKLSAGCATFQVLCVCYTNNGI